MRPPCLRCAPGLMVPDYNPLTVVSAALAICLGASAANWALLVAYKFQ